MNQSVTCLRRERITAITGIALAFVAAFALCVAAWSAAGNGGGGGGIGGGSGTGIGTGIGDGVGDGIAGGEGPKGGGVGDGPPSAVPAPEGEQPVVVAQVPVEPPKIGFTVPEDAPSQVTAPSPPPPSGGNGPGSGGGSGGGTGSGAGGSGHGSGKGGGGGSEFMGVRSKAIRVAYVIDFSGSMQQGDRLVHTKLELRRSIQKLPEEGSFAVYFFNTSATPMPPGKMVPATTKNKADAIDWFRAQEGGGGTDPTEALEMALADPQPDVIYLMTDGIFQAEPVFEVIERLNKDKKVSINTIAFHEREAEAVLKRIAAENRGDYTYIAPPNTKP